MDATLPLRLPDRNTFSIIAQIGNGPDHRAMDVSTTRARNIAMLVEQAGGPTAFGKLIDRDQVQVSQWTSAAKPKPLGGRLARYIEGKLGHEHGWLDTPQWEAGETAPESHSLHMRLDPAMIRQVHKALQRRYARVGGYNIERDPDIFAIAYEILAGMADASVPDNVFDLVIQHADLNGSGARNDGRSEGVPVVGTVGSTTRADRRKA
jgi:hypothetical protein